MPLPIEDYALIGDTQTAALVGKDGSIDWLCLPRFDSPACFAALLGDRSHGRWQIAPKGGVKRVERRYREDTLVLETDFHTEDGVVRLVDCMPPRGEAPDVVRLVQGLEGRVEVEMELVLRFDYGHVVPWVRRMREYRLAVAGPDAVRIDAGVPVHGQDLTTRASFAVGPGDEVPFVITWYPSHVAEPAPVDAALAVKDTCEWWRAWMGSCNTDAPARAPLAADAEGAHVRAHRRHRRRRDHVAAREARRRAQLGLPLLLAARRHAHADGAAQRRLRGRGARVARLAAARGRRRPARRPDHVRLRRASGG